MNSILVSLCPFPSVTLAKELKDGFILNQPKVCMSCKEKNCWDFASAVTSEEVRHFICSRDVSLFRIDISGEALLINGVFDLENNESRNRFRRKSLRKNKVRKADVDLWARRMKEGFRAIGDRIEKSTKETIEDLHDIKTATSLVFRNAEAIISRLPGALDEDKLENADPRLKSLIKSVNLLDSRLNMSSIIANPASAAYGRPRRVAIYKVFHTMVRMFEQLAAAKNVRITMRGSSYSTPHAFDSITTLALVLIDNAVKYSQDGGEVVVTVNDNVKGSVAVTVESRGPAISGDDLQLIFQKRFRTENAKKMTASGSGMGLYIASVIADAHKVRIKYEARNIISSSGIASNVFSFYLEDNPELNKS
ncbi:MAG: sensor histidine kinase [Alphaproteobacteria bacterium]|uniref:histidine kinase n=1 Tax=Candidatus Nitrobium versatile TaxID=2884831 RepID=A0A953JBV9_9BACT|nr:sensor histidine kinase [Candidatus Nitrobium versatile]